VERGLLATRMAALRATLDPAVTIQNWHSLGILDFVATINKVASSPPVCAVGRHRMHHDHMILRVVFHQRVSRTAIAAAPTRHPLKN